MQKPPALPFLQKLAVFSVSEETIIGYDQIMDVQNPAQTTTG